MKLKLAICAVVVSAFALAAITTLKETGNQQAQVWLYICVALGFLSLVTALACVAEVVQRWGSDSRSDR